MSDRPTTASDASGQADPTLRIIQVSKTQGGYAGAFAWGINWEVSGQEDGVIIQKITVSALIQYVFGTRPWTTHPWVNGRLTNWYELWRVQKGKVAPGDSAVLPELKIQQYAEDGLTIPADPVNDWYLLPTVGRGRDGTISWGLYGQTEGWLDIRGYATYYECLTLDKLKEKGFDFRTRNARTGAGNLYSDGPLEPDKEEFLTEEWTRQSEVVHHDLHVSWVAFQPLRGHWGETTVTPSYP